MVTLAWSNLTVIISFETWLVCLLYISWNAMLILFLIYDFAQDSLPTFPDAEAFACIERELGLQLDSIFSAISLSPIAAASLGQVYKAQLKYSGKVVAVKVQRPGIEESIGLDFYLIRGLGFLINKYVDVITSDVVALVDEFARRVFQELNYVQVSLLYVLLLSFKLCMYKFLL